MQPTVILLALAVVVRASPIGKVMVVLGDRYVSLRVQRRARRDEPGPSLTSRLSAYLHCSAETAEART